MGKMGGWGGKSGLSPKIYGERTEVVFFFFFILTASIKCNLILTHLKICQVISWFCWRFLELKEKPLVDVLVA